MIELRLDYRQIFILPMTFEDKPTDVVQSRTLVWLLRPVGGGYFTYACQNARAVNARDEDCSTPPFHPTRIGDRSYIPEYVLDWMNRFAKVMQIGAAYGRSK